MSEREGRFSFIIRTMKSVIKDGFVLDVGCGNGFLSRLLLEELEGVSIVGLDIDLRYCKMAKKSVERLNFDAILADAQHLPFRKGLFEAIIAAELIEHLPYPVAFLRDVHTSLRDEGMLIISTPNVIGAWSIF
ncbi:MAG: hypothetical protein DRJ03_15350 [Chloroflexi bacterium]|nr:MAG: hypothetical protein DRJ03_15350 [Chloroflexota bacterium]